MIYKVFSLNKYNSLSKFKSKQNFSHFESFFNFRSDYGQAGKLNLNLPNFKYEIYIETIWEDYSSIEFFKKNNLKDIDLNLITEGEKNEIIKISESENNSPIDETKYLIKTKIPEYYSYNFTFKGNLTHNKTEIDAKTFGDVFIKNLLDDGNINLTKIKSENVEIETINGEINIKSYLEGQKLCVKSNKGNIYIKKAGITGQGLIKSNFGNIRIDSIYGSNENNDKNSYFIIKQNEKIDFEIIKNNIIDNILKNTHSKIEVLESNVKIQDSHGNLIINVDKGDVNIDRCNNNSIYVNLNKGNININVVEIKNDSLINSNNEGKNQIIVDHNFKGNIYLLDTDKYLEEKIYENHPTLFLKGVKEIDIKRGKAFNFMDFLKNKYKKS